MEDIMKRSLLLALPFGLALLSAPASARTYMYPGAVCQAALPSQVGCIENTQFGVHNVCGSIATVECPLDSGFLGLGATVSFVSFTGYDRSTLSNVSCQVQKVNSDGGVLFTSTISTTGSGAGSQLLSTFPNISENGFWRMRCSIPAVQAGQFSHVATLSMLTGE
jgi:hypothetical protein